MIAEAWAEEGRESAAEGRAAAAAPVPAAPAAAVVAVVSSALPLPNWALSAASMPVATEFRASTSAAAFNKGAAFSWSFWAEPLLLLLLLL